MTSFDEAFVEVADGRVSRVHCCIGRATNPATSGQQAYLEVDFAAETRRPAAAKAGASNSKLTWLLQMRFGESVHLLSWEVGPLELRCRTRCAVAQDLSSNGTFVNGRKLKSAQDGAERRWLTAGDRISLVMSVKPLHEQYYIYHTGEL